VSEEDVRLRFIGEDSSETLDLVHTVPGVSSVLSDLTDQLDLRGAGLVVRASGGWILTFGKKISNPALNGEDYRHRRFLL